MSDHRDGVIINAAIKNYFKSLELDGGFIIFRDNGDDIKIDAELNITDLVATIEYALEHAKPPSRQGDEYRKQKKSEVQP